MRDNEPEPAETRFILTKSIVGLTRVCSSTGGPPYLNILAFACRFFQQWGYTVECTRWSASDRIKSHPRDPHTVVDTGLLFRATLEALTEKFPLSFQWLRVIFKTFNSCITIFNEIRGYLRNPKPIMCAARGRGIEPPVITPSRQNNMANLSTEERKDIEETKEEADKPPGRKYKVAFINYFPQFPRERITKFCIRVEPRVSNNQFCE